MPHCRGFFFISDLFTNEIGLNLGKEMTVFRISWSGRFYVLRKVLFFDIFTSQRRKGNCVFCKNCKVVIGLNLGKEMTVFRISWSGRFYVLRKVLFFDIFTSQRRKGNCVFCKNCKEMTIPVLVDIFAL